MSCSLDPELKEMFSHRLLGSHVELTYLLNKKITLMFS